MLEAVPMASFDPDVWHVMEKRDNALIEDELLHGSVTRKFVYSFDIGGTVVSGISVIGARHLAHHYGGLKHRIVASVRKIGKLFTFTSYPSPGMPMSVQVSALPELEEEPDSYSAIIEIGDIKTGNAVQMESQEARWERRRDGSLFERPQYAKIAQAKAYRNAVLALIPQDVQLVWKARALEAGERDVITQDVIGEKRAGVLQYATRAGIAVDRQAIAAIGWDQISGLSDAARDSREAFTAALYALNLAPGQVAERVEAPAARRSAPPPAGQPQGQQQQRPRQPEPAQGGQAGGQPAGQQPAGQQQPGTQQPGTQQQTTQQPRQQQAPAATRVQTGFAMPLVDEVGEFDPRGDFTDPGLWAEAFLAIADRCFPPDLATLRENNEKALVLAAGYPNVGDLLRGHLPANPRMSPVPLDRNKDGVPQLTRYVNMVRVDLAQMTAERMAEFAAVNRPVWAGLPSDTRTECERAVAQRCSVLGIVVPSTDPAVAAAMAQPEAGQGVFVSPTSDEVAKVDTPAQVAEPAAQVPEAAQQAEPAQVGGPTPPPAQPEPPAGQQAPDRDAEMVELMIIDIEAQPSKDDLEQHIAQSGWQGTAIRLAKERPDLHERLLRTLAAMRMGFSQ
jgi:hypothetical protein